MSYFENIVKSAARYLDVASQAAMIGLILLIAGNVLLGNLWKPIFGAYELSTFLTAAVVSLALANCAIKGDHVSVSIVVERFSQRIQVILGIITGLLSAGFSLLLAWQTAVFATGLWQKGEVSGTLYLPLHPIAYGISLGIFVLGLVFLLEVIKSLKEVVKE